jgi:hypothetical protein
MEPIYLYASAELTSAVLCGTNTVGAAIRIDKLSLFSTGEICRECLAKTQSLRQGERRK